ncbi:class I tRNA ligase family protein [Ferruginibacter paludis]|uniref:leucine--tRNA ligase n=1 Tax=Ferruginibacter paludis TaxID=1310417 RepID=UPI0025B2FEF7|nr:class I tRNA ligase family protein [Ferruginibacter paludis]MDN3658515.1 class I tRNA ligase family protein [Ferruginibacter paludis]
MEYRFNEIEKKWQDQWKADKVYQVSNESAKPKYYVLDMFPYPSGAGLHVGHPLGYIASDIYSRYKRLKGFNVLHPMGFDSFGLPAEQYALETGQHPAETTKKNIATFKSQLDKIGFCYDWEREVQTSDPNYYQWTQWIFLQLFNSYFCNTEKKALPISQLIKKYETKGALPKTGEPIPGKHFTAEEWKAYSKQQQEEILMNRRLAFSKYGEVNWCEALGTVLANDEVVNGVSERGGHPVEKKKMRQWYLRITAYADRLLEGLETVEFSESMKEMQRNWIGKSQGAEMDFVIKGNDKKLRVYTTRPDTIFGVDFMVVAPEHELVAAITSAEQKEDIDKYLQYVKSRSERERLAEAKTITGCFTGAYAINPFDGKEIPIWISEYVLAGYGTGAIMAVPCGDQRDFAFAKHFNIPITNIIGDHYTGEEANATKEAILQNSGFLNGLLMKDAIGIAVDKIEELGIGTRKVNYRMRDAGFSRQRYWGEPFPIIWRDGIAIPLGAEELPLELPHVDKYGPGPEGEGPLANITEWVNTPAGRRETSTMPGYAGSSWYFLRYMDPHNGSTFCDRKASDYWNQVDLYIGGTEHAVGHLLYSRMWTKVLFDLGLIGFDEPFRKLVNQGMITGKSYFFNVVVTDDLADRKGGANKLGSFVKDSPSNVLRRFRFGHQYVDATGKLTENNLRKYNSEHPNDQVTDDIDWLNNGEENYIILKEESEKMSKTKFNVDNPDDLCEKYGADTFRMYEMFLGPVEASKPWDTKGIEGVHRFLRKLWRLFNDDLKGRVWTDEKPTDAELKILHRTIKKIEEDTEKFSFNTAVSAFMICINDLFDVKCHKKEVLEKILILMVPYAPHIAEELWHQLGNEGSILDATYPTFNPALLVESTKEYPISINGKVRANLSLALDLDQKQVEEIVLQHEVVQKWLEGKDPKKIIYVKNKMINVVV